MVLKLVKESDNGVRREEVSELLNVSKDKAYLVLKKLG